MTINHETICVECGAAIRWCGSIHRPPACGKCNAIPQLGGRGGVVKPTTIPESQLAHFERVRMPFGKYAGRTLGEIARADVKYIDWLNGLSNIRSGELKLAIAAVAQAHEDEILRMVGDDME